MARQPKRKPLDPKVSYQCVPRDWDWADSGVASTILWDGYATVGEAQANRELSRALGAHTERIIRITTTIEIVDEGDDSKVGPGWLVQVPDRP